MNPLLPRVLRIPVIVAAVGALVAAGAAGASAAPDPTLTLSGELVAVADHDVPAGETPYAIRTSDGVFHPVDPAALQGKFDAADSGDRVVAKVIDGQAAASTTTADVPDVVAASITPVAAAGAVGGDVRAYVVAIDDSAVTTDVTLASARATTQAAIDYWKSEGRGLWASSTIVDAKTWSAANSCSQSYWQIWNSAGALFPGVSFGTSSGNHLMVYSPSSCNYGYVGIGTVGTGPTSGGTIQIVGAVGSAAAHELGHNFSLGHSNMAFRDKAGVLNTGEYYGFFGPMAGTYGDYPASSLDAAYQAKLGVPDAATAVRTVTSSTPQSSATLVPVNSATGLRGLRFVDADGVVWFVEYRPGQGIDAKSVYASFLASGAYAYSGSRLYFQPGVRVYQLSGSDTFSYGRWIGDALYLTLSNGEQFSSSTGKFTVSVDSTSASGAAVRVAFATTDTGGGTDPEPGAIATSVTTTPAAAVWGATANVKVAVSAADASTPTGKVVLSEGATVVGSGTLAGGSVTIPVRGLAAGAHWLSAQYVGDVDHAASSAEAAVTVSMATSTTKLNTALGTTSGTASVTVTTDSGVVSTGRVDLTLEGQLISSANLSGGRATFTLPGSWPGSTQTVVAKYVGTPSIKASSAAAGYRWQYTSSISAPAMKIVYGTASTLTAKVTSTTGIPNETVQVLEGTKVIGSRSLASGTARIALPATLSHGTHTLTVKYLGNSHYRPSSTTTTVTVLARTALKVTAPTSWTIGRKQVVSVGVSTSAGTASGSIRVMEGSKLITAAPITAGVAKPTLPATLSAGAHRLTFVYDGSATAASTSKVVDFTVNKVKTTTSATTAKTWKVNTSNKVVVKVSGASTGTVRISLGATKVAEGKLAKGTVTLSVKSGSKVTAREYEVRYLGTSTLAPSVKIMKATIVR